MLEIAKILKPQGIKGEVKALPLTNVLAVFKSIKNAFVGGKDMVIEKISMRQGFLYIKFKDINTRNDAELLRNQSIKISKDILENFKEEDEFLIDDLIGMVIYDEKGALVGQIVEVINYGSSDIFIIEKEGRQMQVPFVEGVFEKEGDSFNCKQRKAQRGYDMKIDILTLFPESFSYLDESIIKRARQKGIIGINIVDIRSFSKDKHKKCDDYPFGGGSWNAYECPANL